MLKRVLLTMCAERPNDWDKYLPALLFAVREIPQESLGFSIFELLYGRNVRGLMQILRELWSVEETDEHARLTYQYVIDLRERLEKTFKLAQENVRKLDIKRNAGWLQGHWWGFISRNYVVWPTFLLTNVFIALKGSHFWFLFFFWW